MTLARKVRQRHLVIGLSVCSLSVIPSCVHIKCDIYAPPPPPF